ncbi:hypothetical protein EYF80_004775 [Liparis tanakae]|uniref:Uncharacterized protein n=1 Tax=Liparis tanakae TaxID=230148 RepID=A0A4Z2J5A8_9TELE|nr:hypothetical protein EYF80_004775 [Liparis tanakae]
MTAFNKKLSAAAGGGKRVKRDCRCPSTSIRSATCRKGRALQGRAVLCAGGIEVRQAGHLALQRRRTGGVRRQIRRVPRAPHLLLLVLLLLLPEAGRVVVIVVGHDHDVAPLLVEGLRGGRVAAALTRLAVLHQHRHRHPPRGLLLLLLLARAAVLLHLLLGHFVFGLPLHLVPYKPGVHRTGAWLYSLVEKRGSGLAPYQPVAAVLPLMPSWYDGRSPMLPRLPLQ